MKVWQDTLSIPTYRESKPEPLPPFDQLAVNGVGNFFIYPYTMRQYLTQEKYAAEWRIVHLENEYLHCRILPDLGGHLYSCLDKLSGKEMFYAMSSFRKTASAPRGAWVAGGVETSFPIAHSRVSVSPAQFATAVGPDGSGSVSVGVVDRVSGMEWRVSYTLHPGAAALEQKVRLYNGSYARQPYQWWTNAAIRLPDSGLRLTFPMWVTSPHGAGNLDSWPISTAGVDLTNTENYQETIGLFAYGSREPFFAAFNPESKTGVSHWADPREVPGKKVWVWGKKQQDYRDTYSDDHSGYTEIQAGLLPTQEMMEFLQPQQSRTFTELWIPSRDTGGITRATPAAVLYLRREQKASGPALAFDLNVTRAIRGASITISHGDHVVYEQKADLEPKAAFHGESQSAPAGVKCRFELKDASGKTLLAHVEDTYDAVAAAEVKLRAPMPKPAATAGTAETAAVARGEEDELIRMLDRAAETYRTARAKSVEAQKAAGRLAASMGRFSDAVNDLTAAQAANPSDAETSYYLGVAKSRLGADAAAQALWRAIGQDPAFGVAAEFELACSLARTGDRRGARERLHALAERGHERAAALEIALLRRLGQKDEAKAALNRLLAADPMNSSGRVEGALLGRDDPALWKLLGQDPEWVLDIVDEYFQIGDFEGAAALLDRQFPAPSELETDLGGVAPQDYPLIAYYRGYARLRMGQSPAADFRAASDQSTLYVYPSRVSSFAVLRAAVEQDPRDPTAHYLLGCLLFNSRMTDEALTEWQAAKEFGSNIPGYHETVARVLTAVERDSAVAQKILKEAVASSAPDPSLKKALQTVATARPAGAAAPPPRAAPAFHGPAEAAAYAFDSLTAGRTIEALAVFNPRNFPEEKQPPEVRQAYIEAQVQHLLDLTRAGQCAKLPDELDGLGKEDSQLPFTFASFGPIINQLRIQFFLGLAEAACGNRKAAEKRWAKIAKASPPPSSPDYAYPLQAANFLNPASASRGVEVALEKLRNSAATVDRGVALYSEGVLLRIAGRADEASKRFAEGSKSESVFVRYLNNSAEPSLVRSR